MNYAIVTPAKNEEVNIDYLFFHMRKQIVKPKLWVIINDNSDDSTKELVEKNIEIYKDFFKGSKIILYNNTEKAKYDLKVRYSKVVKIGFDIIEKAVKDGEVNIDYIGILDADLFPEEIYFDKLMKTMKKYNIAIASGNVKVLYQDKVKIEKVANNWPRGGCRLYGYEEFKQIGFDITRSPDTYSCLKAQMMGYKIANVSGIYVTSFRETGSRHAYKYYGESDRYFGYPKFYAATKFAYKFVKSPEKAIAYIDGYLNMREECKDKDVVRYVKKSAAGKIVKKLKVKK